VEPTAVPGDRFGFGENWSRFARGLPPARIAAARASLAEMLGRESLAGLSFLDVGSGSGLFSLAASQLGASPIHSLDFDPLSVETTRSLRDRFAPESEWTVERASALDAEYMSALGRWDVVYSWGVLHHTGDLWSSLGLTCERVAPGGCLFVSVYNDQGRVSAVWTRIKRLYNRLPRFLRPVYTALMAAPMEARAFLGQLRRGHPGAYFAYGERGMSRWRDLVDWVGGYPFEVARPDQVIAFCGARGLVLRRQRTVGKSHGCNEFVFELGK
jgi:2-polyprenyl-6-hydroxyphenyl methylase/3-demethylubiquinone-9 3-methyltransferase